MEFLRTIWYRHRFALVAGMFILISLAGVIAKQWPARSATSPVTATAVPDEALVVDIEGAVVAPGLRRLPPGSLVDDAIAAAGGTTEQADALRLAKEINRADPLKNHQKIYIPLQGEVAATAASQMSSGGDGGGEASGDAKVSLNAATRDQLESLPGIGPATAAKIIDYRDAKGGFSAIEELNEVPGIGEAKFEELRELVVL